MRWDSGDYPLNTHGGQLGVGQAGMAGGMSHITEAIWQVQGRADQRQVAGCNTAYVTGTGGFMSEQAALILEVRDGEPAGDSAAAPPDRRRITQPFCGAAKEHRLVLPKDSQDYFFYPRPIAPGSMDADLDWGEVEARGTVYSFTVDRRGTAPEFVSQAPYVIAIVELEAGPHLTTNIVGCGVDDVCVGLAVEAVFEDVTDEITLIKFRPAG